MNSSRPGQSPFVLTVKTTIVVAQNLVNLLNFKSKSQFRRFMISMERGNSKQDGLFSKRPIIFSSVLGGLNGLM